MTKLLQQALSRLQELPAAEQDAIAALILEELADEKKWDDTFAGSQDQLSRMAQKAREDVKAGRISDAGIDEL